MHSIDISSAKEVRIAVRGHSSISLDTHTKGTIYPRQPESKIWINHEGRTTIGLWKREQRFRNLLQAWS